LWKAECGDTLTSLAQKKEYGGKGANWVCLWPAAGTKDHGYPDKIMPGDVYDANNLAVPAAGAPTLRIELDDDLYAGHVSVYGSMTRVRGDLVAAKIREISSEGGTPISYLLIGGHGGMQGTIGGVAKNFDVATIVAMEQQVSFTRAQQKKGPVRCWFSRNANAIFTGCESGQYVASDFAAQILRKGATSWGTTTYVGHQGGKVYWGWDGTAFHHSTNLWQYAPIWKSYNGGL
jgi:hypothetical protein